MENQSETVQSILGRLRPQNIATGLRALNHILPEAHCPPISFDFQRMTSSEGEQFLASESTLHPEEDEIYRNPFNATYHPSGEAVDYAVDGYKKADLTEQQINALMKTYSKMYFKGGQAVGNFYVVGGSKDKLMGVFLQDSEGEESKHLDRGLWRSVTAVTVEIGANNSIKTSVRHNMYLEAEASSKFYGEIKFTICKPRQREFSFEEKLAYKPSERFMLFVKYCGKAFEKMETDSLNEVSGIIYGRTEHTLSKLRCLQEDNAFYLHKKKLINKMFCQCE